MVLGFFSKILGKVVHTLNIFDTVKQVTPETYRLFRELIKMAVDRLEYAAKKDVYDRMEAFVNKTPNRWDNIFYEMLRTRFPLVKVETPAGTVKCDCGHSWLTTAKPENYPKLSCPVCGTKNLFIRL